MQKKLFGNLIFILVMLSFLLVDNNIAYSESVQKAVVATVAPDWSSSAHSIISVDAVDGHRSCQNNLFPTSTSDIGINAYGKYFYRIERYQGDNVTKFDINNPSTLIWQFSTNDKNEEGSSNPYSLIFVNETKAYLLRYGKTKAWIVNPSANIESEFKIGELDLSAYADADGIPEMTEGIIIQERLYIITQRLDRNNNWTPNTPYIAIFDTKTDKAINAGIPNSDGFTGIPLPIKNPASITYLKENNKIYIQAIGSYESSWSGIPADYSGGIISIDPSNYNISMVLDDGDTINHPYGNISGMAIISATKGYFIGYSGWEDNALYTFNPSNGQVNGITNSYLVNKNLAGMESGTYVDKNNMIWVCNSSDAEIIILDTKDDSVNEKVSTELNPKKVIFMTVGDEGDDETTKSDDSNDSFCFIKSIFGE
ncbi:MAG: hypothetical protein HQK76_08060 [Desulfobacterales bacterium]|nr:hypothetical protein [Desulfobacterales bacterium]